MDCFVAEPVNERARLRDPLGRNGGEGYYTVIARSAATKQSSLSLRSEMDCFAALAMTERQRICFAALAMTGRAALLRHCEERSDEAIQSFFAQRDGLLRC